MVGIISTSDHKWTRHQISASACKGCWETVLVLIIKLKSNYVGLSYTGGVNLFSAACAANCLLKSSTQGEEQQRRSKTSSDLIPKRLLAHCAQSPADACTVDSSQQEMQMSS